jgi:uncharacterized protein YkwD
VARARALLVAALALSTCAPSPRAEPPDAGLAGLERAVFAAVNRHRRSLGLAELVSDPAIAALARGHSVDMAQARVGFGHAGFRARVDAIGRTGGLRRAAENVSRHTRPAAQVPAEALERWLASEQHRRNLEGDFRRSGVGAARDAGGTIYLTQIFVAD